MAAHRTQRIIADGKYFRLGPAKFYIRGLTYGPFAPDPTHGAFASPEATERDFRQISQLGGNLVRVYYVPPRWFLDLAQEHGLKVLVDIPWARHVCFLDSKSIQQQARRAVREGVAACAGHPAVFAWSVVNEISPEIVRWSGVRRVEKFIDELVQEAKSADPDCLCTFTNYPSSEFLLPRNLDFLSFNVYLHDRKPLESYLARLQMLADTKPLLLAELGMDSLREGEQAQREFLAWQIETVFRNGLAGAVVFSFTDDWFRGGMPIRDWAFGLTTVDRKPKQAFAAVQQAFAIAPHFPLPRTPKVSVVVASYNGARTLRGCLESLAVLNYPNYEVILVDDGSTDQTQQIAADFPKIRNIRQENLGLSAARNTGIAAASGEVVAFTDSDCRADEDWLYYLVGDLLVGCYAGIGGHNFLPPDDSPVAAAVMVSPGGPAHVMLNDREAEHIPGCNMAFFKWALDDIGGFDPLFRKAGDDVDVCWRLQQRGHRIGFSPGAFVWHYRRSTVRAYLSQQQGYGEAEAFLALKHPDYFNVIGRGIWRGRIYAPSKFGVILQPSIIYHGVFGSGLFQRIYHAQPSFGLMVFTSLEYHAFFSLPLILLSIIFPWLWSLAGASVLASAAVCLLAASQADLAPDKQRFWSRPLVALMFFLQPLERGFARFRSRFQVPVRPLPSARHRPATTNSRPSPHSATYWSPGQVARFDVLQALKARLEQEHWPVKIDTGWTDYDLEIGGNRWCRTHLIGVTEQLDQGRLNLRFRLDSAWSLPAKAIFALVLGVQIILIAALAPIQPWIWMVLLSLSIISWYFDNEQSLLGNSILTLLDEVAAGLGLVNLAGSRNRKSPSATAAPATPQEHSTGGRTA